MMHLLRVGLLLIPGFSLGKEIEECCKRKIVGDDIYNFIKQVGEAKSEFGCMNDCVYSIEGKPDFHPQPCWLHRQETPQIHHLPQEDQGLPWHHFFPLTSWNISLVEVNQAILAW